MADGTCSPPEVSSDVEGSAYVASLPPLFDEKHTFCPIQQGAESLAPGSRDSW